MNQGLFRLIFSKRLGMYIPAPEVAVAQTGSGASSARARRRAILALIASTTVLHAQADVIPLPVSGLEVAANRPWTGAALTAATPTITTIQQNLPQAIAHWSKFNLAQGHTLNIEGQQSNWGMLHRIYDADPSVIAGTINAGGSNYFLNQNGIVFANGAQLNMGSVWAMTASNMTDDLFRQGFINNWAGTEIFSASGGFVTVNEGAHLNAATGGKVVLLAEKVENNGLITTPEGQTILAAGGKVYLKSATDMAGMLVEVESGGTATNLGQIIAERGNVSVVGLAVNQQGKISANSSTMANGSIRLIARDGTDSNHVTQVGKVTLGESSVTEVKRVNPSESETAQAGQSRASGIFISGGEVEIGGVVNAQDRELHIAAATNIPSIVFTESAQLNIGSLWAMSTTNSLTVDPFSQEFIDDIVGVPTFSGLGGSIMVNAGAEIHAERGGKVVLLAKDVTNAGTISTPEGQTILAAGGQVFLKTPKPDDAAKKKFAGLLVDVNQGGIATNHGLIVAERGNVSMVGSEVNQMGRITASTSVRANGSIHLYARDTVLSNGNVQRFGKVTLGAGSVTEVLVEEKDLEEIGNTVALKPSIDDVDKRMVAVDVEGRMIDVKGTISAKGNEVKLTAKRGTENAGATMPVRVFLDDTARIDVSGVDAKAAMSKNQLTVRLYSEELKDTPVLKGSPLLGQTIYVDARKGTDLFDIQPYLDARTQTIAERMSAGGTVHIRSAGDVITKAGSVIDVSGGVIDYAAGMLRESSLVHQGRIVSISEADRNTPYQSLANVVIISDPKSGMTETHILDQGALGNFQQAYRHGADAGTVNMSSTGGSPLLDGSMVANTRHDITQRDQMPDGGKFNLTVGTQNLHVVADSGNASQSLTAEGSNTQTVAKIDTDMLGRGFNHINLNTQGHLFVDTAVTTQANGSVTLKGANVDINHNITTPGGDITISTQTQSEQVKISDGVVLSAAGTWANDTVGMPGAFNMPIALDGGSISISAGDLSFGEDTVMDTSAGAWLNSQGKLAKGNGGDISLESGDTFNLPAQMQAYGFSKGGRLSLKTTRDIQIAGQDPGNNTFWLGEAFFEQGGFSHYAIQSTGNDSTFVIGDSTGKASVIHPKMQTLQQANGFSALGSANSVRQAGMANPVLMAEGLRAPATLDFSAYGSDVSFGSLTVLENTTIRTDIPDINGNVGKITLDAGKQLTMLGSLIAPAGDVKLDLRGAVDATPYDNSQSIFLGENSLINVAGYYLRLPIQTSNVLQARVFDAGSVKINTGKNADGSEPEGDRAGKGFVIIKEGNVIDVSGVSGLVDIEVAGANSYFTSMLHGAAGDIEIRAREGMVLDGSLIGHAQGSGAKGSLTVSLHGDLTSMMPTGERVLTVTSQKQVLATGIDAQDSLAAFQGKAQISTEQMNAGQFDHVSLRSTTDGRDPAAVQHDRIDLESGVNLQARSTLALTSPRINVLDDGNVTLNASHVMFAAPQVNNAVSGGDGLLQVNADWIDLNGSPNISGVKRTELNSRLDIRMRGLTPDNKGSLRVPGELQMTARQIYPVTNSAFTVQAVGAGSNIEVKSSGEAPKAVFSAGGKLTLEAENIQQNGIVIAPLGQVELKAEETLTVGKDSVTSTAAGGLVIPYGYTADGGNTWRLPNNVDQGQLPMEKSVIFSGKNIQQQSGALVDISGNGDTFAYEFIPGLGGSKDILSDKAGVFALLPSLQGEYAPYDYDYYNYNNLDGYAPGIGQSIYISGGNGLAAGYYTLLPARYALLEGAYMVEIDQQSPGLMSGGIARLADGTTLSSGYFTDVNRFSRDAYWTTFKLTNGSVFRNPDASGIKVPAEYMLTSGNDYFTRQAISNGTAIPRLAKDAGQLVLNASEQLTLQATLKTDAAKDGRGAMVDIVSENISVVSEIGADDGTLQLTAQSLNDLNAESILLGGRRSQGDEATEINTIAREISFFNSEHKLEVGELIATAKDKVAIHTGVTLETKSSDSTSESHVRVNGDGALFAMSGKHDFVYDRVGTTPNPVTGVLDIADGSVVNAHQSLVLDATDGANLQGAVAIVPKEVTQSDGSKTLVANGSVTLGANSILLGDADSAVSGMRVDDDLLASFGSLKQVILNSQQNLNLYGDVAIGNAGLDMTINAAGIAGHAVNGSADATINAASLTLKNSSGASYVAGADGAGSQLTVNAGQINVEGKGAASGAPANAGNFNIGGYENVALNSGSDLAFSGTGRFNSSALQTTLSSQRIMAATGSDYTVQAANGNLVTQGNGSVAAQAGTGLGAKLNMTAKSIALGGNIELLSGQFSVQATEGNLDVVDGARINAGSTGVAFDKYTAYTPGGTVSLQADQADINVFSGAEINVGGGEGGNAGTIKMAAANGTVSVATGTLHGEAVEGKTAGSFILDSKQLADFSALNAALNVGGFEASRNLRIRSGDVTIAQHDSVNAQKFVLSADDGSVDILGTINASGQHGGNVQVYAKNDLTLHADSKVLAKGDVGNGKGGKVLLASGQGTISADGALIDVGGRERGQVNMRAERIGLTGLKVDSNATAAIAGADKILLEALSVTEFSGETELNNATLSNIKNDTDSFYAKSADIAAGYADSSDGVRAIVAPHTELRIDDNATLKNDWNLHTLSQGRDGLLTIRSQGDLKLDGSISDGFSTEATGGVLQTGKSWSINLVSGADLNAVNTLETIANVGNMTLANNKLIRTGTGDINIATGGNFILNNAGSVVYTAGQAAEALAGFNAPSGGPGTQYLTGGGDINIASQGNITGSLLTAGGNQQLINSWLFRQGGGNSNLPSSWWLRTELFKQGVATFGGGNVNVSSGGNITNFSVSAPTTGRFLNQDNYRVDGGGDIHMNAAGDIVNGVYYAGKGNINLAAGGAVGRTSNTFGTVIGLQDSTATVSAVRDVYLETVFNPTLFGQSLANTPANALIGAANTGASAFFNTYSENAAVDVSSLVGNVRFGEGDSTAQVSINRKLPTSAADGLLNTQSVTASRLSLGYLPGSVGATAYSGNIEAKNMKLMPSAQGDLRLLAGNDILAEVVLMSDADVSRLPSVFNPMRKPDDASNSIGALNNFILRDHAVTPVHTNNQQEVVIVAKDGSIGSASSKFNVSLPKSASIIAGEDIFNLNIHEMTVDSVSVVGQIQHHRASDLTLIKAGRDIKYVTGDTSGMQFSGPGNVMVQAGRHLDLGAGKGINSVANTVNAFLPEDGASLTVLAGVGQGPRVSDYIDAYINPQGSGPAVLSGDTVTAYRASTSKMVAEYMRELSGNSNLSEADAMAQYLALDSDKQAVFAFRHYSSELLASGEADAALLASGDDLSGIQRHKRGDDAVATMFPQQSATDYFGDLTLFDSKIRTVRDGSIDVLVPGGMVNVGIPGRAVTAGNGIVTESGGAIRAFAETDFQVNQSRVMTQYGGDLVVWVNNGNINAGKGSRSVVAVPETEIFTDKYGKTTLRTKGPGAGSGMQADTYDPDGPSGPLQAPPEGLAAFITPRGDLDAGEAGIRGGRILAVAVQVFNAGNISGTSTVGVPLATTGTLAGTVGGASSVASATTASLGDLVNMPTQDFNVKDLLPSFVSVEVLGLGDIVK